MPQSSVVRSAIVSGLDVSDVAVSCEIDPTKPPEVHVLGMAGSSFETVMAVRCAVKAAGYHMPRGSVTIRCEPTEARPRGAGLGLAIATSILRASGQIAPPTSHLLIVGEVTLGGNVCPSRGIAAIEDHAETSGLTLVTCDSDEHPRRVDVSCLQDLRQLDLTPTAPERLRPAPQPQVAPAFDVDMSKTILLRGLDRDVVDALRLLHASLPVLTQGQCDEVRRIHSVCGEPFEGVVPFRTPHHSITSAGMLGGGRPIVPGELSLATHGLLALTDIERYSDAMLSQVDTAARDGHVRIVRVEESHVMPAAPAMVVATTRDTTTPGERLLRGLGRDGFQEIVL